METVQEFIYFGDRVSAGGGYEAAVTDRTRCGWAKSMECSGLLYGRRFNLKLKGVVYRSYIRPAIVHGSEAWCLKESEIEILRRMERSMVKAMCGVQLNNRKRSTDLMLMLGLNTAIDQLAMANSVRLYAHVLRKEDGHVLGRALDFEVEVQKKKGRPKITCKKQAKEESVRLV